MFSKESSSNQSMEANNLLDIPPFLFIPFSCPNTFRLQSAAYHSLPIIFGPRSMNSNKSKLGSFCRYISNFDPLGAHQRLRPHSPVKRIKFGSP